MTTATVSDTHLLSGDMWSSLAHFLDKARGKGDSR